MSGRSRKRAQDSSAGGGRRFLAAATKRSTTAKGTVAAVMCDEVEVAADVMPERFKRGPALA
jgi:hypothetical protein